MREKMAYQMTVRLFRGEKCFGPGIARLLRLVEEHHSLRGAAAAMGMAYSKAWRIMRECEEALGFPLLSSVTGGKNGWGAEVTEEGKKLLLQYEGFVLELRVRADELLIQYFS